jgi:hypothetical protein
MIIPVTLYKCVCDKCETTAIQGGFDEFDIEVFYSAQEAEENAESDEWQTIGDKHYCNQCSLKMEQAK